MKNDKGLRQFLLHSLNGDGAHADFATAVADFAPEFRGMRPDGAEHSPWQVLEHLRIAQWDVLEYLKNPKHVSPEFPEGYWPKLEVPPDAKAWDNSVMSFQRDFQSVLAMLNDDSTDLGGPLHGERGQSIARKLFMLADHNAYHVGEMVLLRRVLGAWK